MRIDHQHKLHIVALFCALASGCSAHASFRAEAGSYGEDSRGRAGSGGEQARPSSNVPAPSARADATPPARSDQALHESSAPAVPPAAPAATTPVHTQQPVAHALPAQKETTVARRDHDRGHGNDADRHDEDNPGRKHDEKRVAQGGDHDRGHGNDADGVDEQNPGKSKKKK